MSHKSRSDATKRNRCLTTVIVLTALVVGIFVTWSTARRTSREMRVHLLDNARIAAQTLGIGRVTALSGTVADMR